MNLKVDYDDLELVGFDAGGVEMFDYEGQPFTGIVVNKIGNVVVKESEYQNGYKEGLQRAYHYPSGSIEMEYTLKNNSFEGVVKRWDEQGNLIRESNWHNGQKLS